MTDAVSCTLDDHVVVITLTRPEARNAVDGAVARGLEAAIDRLESDPDAWVAVLRADTSGQQRPVFCAGADLKLLASGGGGAMYTERGGFAGFVQRERTKPVIVAVDGLATAGGLEIVLTADIVVASTAAAFGLAEVKRSLIAAAGGLFRLPRAVGRSVALDAILTGEPISAERAHALGLVSRLTEPGGAFDEAMRVARSIAEAAPLAVAASRAIALRSDETDDALWELSTTSLERVMATDDYVEGVNAFVDKRPPQWQGR